MDITAIIVSFGRRKYTIDCINSLHRLYPKIKILVGENGKPDKKIKKIVESIGGGILSTLLTVVYLMLETICLK